MKVLATASVSDSREPPCVLAVACDTSAGAVVVATSAFELKVSDQKLELLRTLGRPAHRDRINEITFGAEGCLYSASSDGTVRSWDLLVPEPVATLNTGFPGEEVWSVSRAEEGHLLAAGTGNSVVLWDARKAARPMCRWDFHTESVTQVRFQPGSSTKLVSGSVDGLICTLDCRTTDEDDAVTAIHNADCSVSVLGFFGPPPAAHIYCISTQEELSVWDLQRGERVSHFDQLLRQATLPADGRRDATEDDMIGLLDCVNCGWDAAAGRLILFSSDDDGTVHAFAVEPSALVALYSLPAAAPGACDGHTQKVRCLNYGDSELLTGGEDGQLCLWS